MTMRVDVSPRQADITPGRPQPVTITIANTSAVIGGYEIRVLGADPGWVRLEAHRLSLFPDESRAVQLVVTPPEGVPAGARRIAVQVRQLNPPEQSTIVELDLQVPSAPAMRLRADPVTVTAGRRAGYSVIVENTGNTVVNGRLSGEDPEGKVRFAFRPEAVTLAPGEHAVVDLRAQARRPVAGSPRVRPLALFFDQPPADGMLLSGEPDPAEVGHGEQQPLGQATFLQKALLTRGSLSLLGLLAAVTVFAIILTVALSRLVGQSTADRDLALQIAAAANNGGTGGTSGVAGTVRLLTSGKPVPAVSVSVFSASDTSTPVATTATGSAGTYRVTNLAAGKYLISFRGAGFIQLWYPSATTSADATTVTLAAGQLQAGLDVTLGGIPASISGTVTGTDVADATVFLQTVPGSGQATTASAGAAPLTAAPLTAPPGSAGSAGAATAAGPAPPPGGGAIVTSVPVSGDGTFSLANVPSPSVYDLVVTKSGYATSTQRIDIGAGEARTGVQLQLVLGDGLISGTVTSSAGPLGGATITAVAGQATSSTVSLTGSGVQRGTFTLPSLPTPATFTITASRAGYASQTLTLTLSAGQKLTGVAVTLAKSAAALQGVVSTGAGGAAGVTVTATNGSLSVSTVTESSPDVGRWELGGLPIPGTYTVTFTRPDLAAQTVSISLDGAGGISGSPVDSAGLIQTTMHSATQDVTGTVTQAGASGCDGSRLGEATVTLTSGSSSYTTTTASTPSGMCGSYYFGAVPPGTYTLTVTAGSGTSPASQVITLSASDAAKQVDVKLPGAASLSGTVQAVDGSGKVVASCGWTVELYLQAQYPTIVDRSATTTCAAGVSNGTFQFAGVPAGSYIVEVHQTLGGSPLASKVVTVAPSQAQVTGAIKVNIG